MINKSMKSKFARTLMCMLIFLFSVILMCSCSVAKVAIDRDGTGSATVTIAKDEGVTRESIDAEIEQVLKGVEQCSGEENRITIEDVKETDENFVITIDFKKISTVKGLGDFSYTTGTELIADQNLQGMLNKFSNGRFPGVQNYTQSTYTFPNRAKELGFKPTNVETGETVELEDFYSASGVASQAPEDILFSFYLVGFDSLQSITFELKGKINYVAGANIELTEDKDGFTVTPIRVKSNILKFDETGEPVSVVEETSMFAGYVFFTLDANYTPIIFGIIITVAVLGLLAWGIVSGRIKRALKSKTCKLVVKNYDLYLMMIPAFVLLFLFCYKPMTGVILAFKNYKVNDGVWGSEWVGFKNFIDLLTKPGSSFWMLARNTFILALLKFIFGFICTIGLAILFSYLKPGIFKKTVQTISYFPYFIGWVTISGIAYLFLSFDTGILNRLLNLFGAEPIKWYNEPQYWRGILTFTAMWKTVGYGTIVYLAGIASIDPALYEAATIDGANRVQQLFHIVLPALTPIIGIQMIFSLGNLVKDDFDQIYTMTGGGNSYLLETTEVIGAVVFKSAGNVASYSSAMAMGLMQSVVSLVIVLLSNRAVKKAGMESLF